MSAAQLGLFEPDPNPGLTSCTCGPRAITRCGHCTHCDRCHDCGRCSGHGCRCACDQATTTHRATHEDHA